MRKNIFEIMKLLVERELDEAPMEALAISEGETTDKETGEIKPFVRLDVEVPKGNGPLARCQFSVKIPDGKLLIKEEDMEKNDYISIFHGLKISYIDSKGNVYFRADSYSIEKEG